MKYIKHNLSVRIKNAIPEKKEIKICLVVVILIVISICLSLLIIHQIRLYNANRKTEDIVIGDSMEVLENNQLVITEYNNIGTLTIPAIPLENASINEEIEIQ